MKKTNIYEISCCALFAALMCIFGPMSVPIGPIPVSLTNFVIYVACFLLGARGATISYIVYILLGVAGLPVFSGYIGGIPKLVGPTGGYLLGFVFITFLGGLAVTKSKANVFVSALAFVLTTVIAYILGTIWFVIVAKATVKYAISVCVLPFIPFDLGKIVIACIIGKPARAALKKIGLI